ncbi:MAG: hypothetical protein M0P74_00875 [Syntrophales bacterium]|jgi:hypothetical protein|nr:hypothetical protein [Syntrophales bacterium]
MIGIATRTYDLIGARVFRDMPRSKDQENRSGARRVSRTGTLDGGCVIADMGFSDGDRGIYIEEPSATIESVNFARYIVEEYALVIVAMEDGAYEAAPESYAVKDGILSIRLLVSEKVSE